MEIAHPPVDIGDSTDSVCLIPTRRVLVLDDDDLLKVMIKNFLKSNFYDVVAVTNGGDGIRAVLHLEFDIIICDMVMPTISGTMFYNAVKGIKPHLCPRFLFITGCRGDTEIEGFLKKVKGTVLPKPFQMDELLDAITRVEDKNGIC
jgi:CheY-like chemotaxis protein